MNIVGSCLEYEFQRAQGRSGRRGSEADVDKPAYKTDAFRMMVMKVSCSPSCQIR